MAKLPYNQVAVGEGIEPSTVLPAAVFETVPHHCATYRGASRGIRTPNPLVRSQMRYPLRQRCLVLREGFEPPTSAF